MNEGGKETCRLYFIVRFSMNKPPAMLVVGILALASSKKPPVINYVCYWQ